MLVFGTVTPSLGTAHLDPDERRETARTLLPLCVVADGSPFAPRRDLGKGLCRNTRSGDPPRHDGMRRARPEVAAAVSGGRHDSMSATRVRHSASGRGVGVAGEDLQTNKVGVRRTVLLDPAPGPEVAPHDNGIDESLAALIGEVRVGEAEAP